MKTRVMGPRLKAGELCPNCKVTVRKPEVHTCQPVSGQCRFCGCVEDRACLYNDPHTHTTCACGWVDDAHTVCSNPRCVAAMQAENVKTVMAEFDGKVCACGNRKRPETSFCFACTQTLPAELRADLHGLSVKSGYVAAYTAAIVVLNAHGRVNGRTA